jgi:TolA-binding protein
MRRLLVITGMLCLGLLAGGCAPVARRAVAQNRSEQAGPGTTAAHADSTKSAANQPAGKVAAAGKDSLRALSPAAQLLIRACDNYLIVNPQSPKTAEVLEIEASLYYNNRHFEQARGMYQSVIDKFPKTTEALSAIRMMAQSYYEEKQFDEAQVWYRKLKDIAVEGGDKQEAMVRIAESMFGIADALDRPQRYKEASEAYERVAMEFPDAKVADAALYNAGLAYEKIAEWSRAILAFQRLAQKYPASSLLAKAGFRTGKCYEKLLQWETAGEMYLRVVANNPRSDLAPTALYNAGFSFENAGKLPEAAATFEKLTQLYPNADDVADVLFKAGEIYGKLKDWDGVTRVNQEFSRRFGNDQDRIVQALCMVGVALYMQDKRSEAVDQLKKAVVAFGRLKDPSVVNKYYAAKAQYTIGEILQISMNAIALTQPKNIYKTQLKEKSDLLDQTVHAYAKVIDFSVLEWTARSIFQVGQAYEDFAMGIMKQQRPAGMTVDEMFALELGIAQALEEYFVGQAMHYHEQNVKLGIKEKSEDKFILASRKKLTYLPFMAGKNFLALASIYAKTEQSGKAEGLALIAKKLDVLQKIAPYQERAIDLLLKCLERGSLYQETDEFYKEAAGLITQTAFSVGETYSEVASIAREAPIPGNFDNYEKLIYKTKLLTQIESYENQALDNYLKALKIADAYKIEDEYVKKNREAIARLLFVRGRCYDLLSLTLTRNPPYPNGVDEAQKEVLGAQFEEAAVKFQDQAFAIYKTIIDYANKRFAAGDFVTQAYVRLFQSSPEEYGAKKEKVVDQVIGAGPQWKCSADSAPGWAGADFADDAWHTAHKSYLVKNIVFDGFGKSTPDGMWFGSGNPKDTAGYAPENQLYFRRVFYSKGSAQEPRLRVAAIDSYAVCLNGQALPVDSTQMSSWRKVRIWDLAGKLRDGKNVLAISVRNSSHAGYGVFPVLSMKTTEYEYIPQPPGSDSPLDPKEIADGSFKFFFIKNFSEDAKETKKSG